MNNTKIFPPQLSGCCRYRRCRCGPDRLRLLRFQHRIFRGRLCRCFF